MSVRSAGEGARGALGVGIALLTVVVAAPAFGHGGLPVSLRILRQSGGDTMYVPVYYWGIWVGQPHKAWSWICEEAIVPGMAGMDMGPPPYRQRVYSLGPDGTLWCTDAPSGMEVSTDNGCTWGMVTGDFANYTVAQITPDPVDGKTAWVVTKSLAVPGDPHPPTNGVWVTHDHGKTFSLLPGLPDQTARVFSSVKLSADGKTLYATSRAISDPNAPALHVATAADHFATFRTIPVTTNVDDMVPPTNVELLAIDPRNPQVVYARARGNTTLQGETIERQALFRSIDGGVSFGKLLAINAVLPPADGSKPSRGIDDVAFDVAHNEVLVATAQGLYGGTDAGNPPAATMTLSLHPHPSQAQCVDVHNGTVYACAEQYMDHAGIAESTDDYQQYDSALNYLEAKGAVQCPAGTPVARICPGIWNAYYAQLDPSAFDFSIGTDDRKGGCGCTVGGVAPTGAAPLVLFAGLALWAFARRRRA